MTLTGKSFEFFLTWFFLTVCMCVNESLTMTHTPGLGFSVAPQLHLSPPPSHFKSRKLIKPSFFFISGENETGGERR